LLTYNSITKEGIITLKREKEGLYAIDSQELLKRRGSALLLRV
jgi:hypothetical protein